LGVAAGGVFGFAGPVTAEPRGASQARAGWEAIQAGKTEEAARAFREAIAANAQDAMLYLGAGLAAHLQGQENEAQSALQQALRLNPKLTAASLLLGEMAYRAGDLEAAIRTYKAYRWIGTTLLAYPADVITVVLYTDERRFFLSYSDFQTVNLSR
jgi:tetratricopeptide (TPR) repeat protein